MSMFRYFRFDGATEGEWPTDHPLKAGTILRIDIAHGGSLPMNAWNEVTKCWAEARWTEVGNPALKGPTS